MKLSIYVGFDSNEAPAFAVARHSMRRRTERYKVPICGLVSSRLDGYGRPVELRPSSVDRPVMWDVISGAVVTTQHANSRFMVPLLASTGLALFTDGDVLARDDITKIFDAIDLRHAVSCVKHDFRPKETVKKGGQEQTQYSRKNWSSVMVFNCDHAANRHLTLDLINSVPGRDLHRFCWLGDDDSLIGELDPKWNYLVGHSDESIDPALVHFTSGIPSIPGYEGVRFADEWREEMEDWAATDA